MENGSDSYFTHKNDSLGSNETILDALPYDSRTSKGFKVLAYVLVLVASVMGNLFVIYAIKRDYRGKLRRRFTYLMITSIAVSDLLMAVVSVPERITRVLSADEWMLAGSLGLVLCKVVNFVEKVSITVSALHVTALATHRFMAIFYPRRTSKSQNCRLAAISRRSEMKVFPSQLKCDVRQQQWSQS
ncbi:Neuropeptide Y receptor [Exaiptasia diaphana]|nr:Neuropeptide Y receptor [Exaiptasia diaphana]